MQIDGFVPADKTIALEEGVTFVYDTPYGNVTIISKIAGDDNEDFTQAFVKLSQRHDRERKLGQVDAVKQFSDIIRLYGTTVVLKWSTTAKSAGKPIESTVDNFVAMMETPAFRRVFALFQEDCGDLANFRAKQEEDAAKN
ncbi:hypothetical protein SJ05684_c10730 [Sinorhizobium sojae CCBAU 05684]|uniref:Uncharacterized protein n=1 Tax=Sinorhizobium sojae CCBAU 05684 TaxID=716928 RepID=A0A249P9C5_9HYPH|nr:hypothetical protein [Sinorhizobium sojae]ASY62530.1 hypothetical protein SJ05684_c10730 [Sinorhizobium sojae CCBAU 05684]